MSTFEEKLISSVFLRPYIYNKAHPDHRNRVLTKQAWDEIAQETGKGNIQCRTRWRGLRDTFYRNKNKPPSGSGYEETVKWIWHKYLLFLGDFNQPKQTSDNLDGYEDDDIDEINLEGEAQNSVSIEILSNDNLINEEVEPNSAVADGMEQQIPSTSFTDKPSTPVSIATASAEELRNKKRHKESLAAQWGKVIDKFTAAANLDQKTESPSMAFAKYVAGEMDNMTIEEQDELKFMVFDQIRIIKRARK